VLFKFEGTCKEKISEKEMGEKVNPQESWGALHGT